MLTLAFHAGPVTILDGGRYSFHAALVTDAVKNTSGRCIGGGHRKAGGRGRNGQMGGQIFHPEGTVGIAALEVIGSRGRRVPAGVRQAVAKHVQGAVRVARDRRQQEPPAGQRQTAAPGLHPERRRRRPLFGQTHGVFYES